MKPLAAITIVPLCILAGCASSMTRGGLTTDEPRSGVTIDLQTNEPVTSTFPARLTEVTPPRKANQLAGRVITELGGQAQTGLTLCIDSDGRVTNSKVHSRSGISELDQVLSDDARTWRYQPLAAPNMNMCQNVAIVFRVR